MFRRKTACLWWTNTKSTSALKPNWGFWRSSLASRIHPSPSKIVPFASDIACTISKSHPDSSPSTSTAVPPHSTTGEEEETPVLHHPKNDLQEEFDIQTFVFLFHIDKLSHTENHAALSIASVLRMYIYIYGHQALNSSSDHTDGHHSSTPTSFIGVFMLSEGVIWVCVCILVQIYTCSVCRLKYFNVFLDWDVSVNYRVRFFGPLQIRGLLYQAGALYVFCNETWIIWSDWQKLLQLDCH